MKKKIAFWVASVLILVNLILFTTPDPSNRSELTLKQLEALADDGGETPPLPPDEEYPPSRAFPTEWSIDAIIDFLF
jgi:hypothetical protein